MNQEIIYQNIENSIKKILNYVDDNFYSETYGLADRDFWGWRTKDFNNSSFQCLIYTLSCIKNEKRFEKIYHKYNQDKKIDSAFEAYKFGCFEELKKYKSAHEAFPYEKSFCVTSVLLFDLLSALLISNDIEGLLSEEKEILIKSAEFISKNIESHAKIGNHLMAGLASLSLFSKTIQKDNKIVQKGISEISLKLKSIWNDEGWLEEYSGADIGYLTLSLEYLTFIDKNYLKERDEWIDKITNFVKYFFHLDGSIGSFYGSRGSAIIYPSGLFKTGSIEIKNFLIEAIKNKKIPTQEDLDDTNFAPFLNSLTRGYLSLDSKITKNISLPISKDKYLKVFKNAGLVVIKNNSHQTIIDLKNGGSESNFTLTISNRGSIPTLVKNDSKKIFCALNSKYEINQESNTKIYIYSKFYKINTKPLNISNILFSRLLVPFFNLFPFVLKFGKSFLAKRYFEPGKSIGFYEKEINIENFSFDSSDSYSIPEGFRLVENYNYHPIKMASQNYI